MKKDKTKFICQQCGFESTKWMGKCPNCDEWNSFVEEVVEDSDKKSQEGILTSKVELLKDIEAKDEDRIKTGIGEFDRVLGGGVVKGSLVLIGGEPGIGKSTMLLQISDVMSNFTKVLYISGEESSSQIKMRADRIIKGKQEVYFLAETNINNVERHVEKISPGFIIVDSIQTMYADESTTIPGSVSQVRQVTQHLLRLSKQNGITVFIIGHVTKEGSIAGPRVLEHMVDTVLYFEGDRTQSFRILRAYKNRFGSTNEIGVFEMESEGLKEVKNPSEVLLSGRDLNAPGLAVISSMEGTRPILLEVQSLICHTNFGLPRRMSTGIDYNKFVLLLAVLEKKCGINFSQSDVYLNIAGGLKVQEPAADLGIVAALISGYLNIPISNDICFSGEVGLIGEVRPVSNLERRISEAKKMGFKTIVVPQMKVENNYDMNIKKIKNIVELTDVIAK
ncbi:DNA repair protein RadA [Thermoanaerobacterium xylanolyticum LX-11]|uniref:DNA repair protein RadA n=1 Tax=Thermoanaerobacterium xylanolyticum (strain ATCC 49914 / DSM 7097 / LX-11) TaxID=858215 RepID=F6BGE1_THEXL|nr:DNA repair protein RadA [Thermoanaerobacterium xylanolyticum]AEF16359.1 DNA repair protein RadA [Thermoanaerobacterium xylanolyticum LX-11]